MSKSRDLSARGYGKRRVAEKLNQAGVSEDDSRDALECADSDAVEAALRFARRRRIGPFAGERPERPEREKWIAALVRAGHPFALARAIVSLEPGARVDPAEIAELQGH